jgi:molecular chaperone Hsp33
VLRFEPQTPHFACTCSRERVTNMIRGLGQEEADSILAERGEIDVGCDFCGQQYRFDAVDAAQIFTSPGDQPPATPTVQ